MSVKKSRLKMQSLEERCVLSGCAYVDTNFDGNVTLADALEVVSALRQHGGSFPADPIGDLQDGRWLDVNHNNAVAISDAFEVVSYLRQFGTGPFDELWCQPAQPDTTLDVSIAGPPGGDFAPSDNDVVLANVTFDAANGDVLVEDMYVLIGINSNAGEPVDDTVASRIEDLELHNVVTGTTVDAVRLTNAGSFGQGGGWTGFAWTYQIYELSDFIVPQGFESWELRFDSIEDNWQQGDHIRAFVSTETGHHSQDFGGVLASPTTAYNLVAEDLDTGEAVTVQPGGTISSNTLTVGIPRMTVAEKALNSSDTAVENQNNIVLGRFEARASEVEDLLLTAVAYATAEGDAHNLQDGALWVDTDGDQEVDTVLEDGISPVNGMFEFSDIVGGGYVIPAEHTVIFEFHADVASSLRQDNKFRGELTEVSVESLADGGDVGWEISHTPQTLWTFVSEGDLYVTLDSTPIRNRQLLGGELGEPVLRIEMRAENEPIDVTSLRFTTPDGVDPTSVDRFELYREGETQLFAIATRSGAGGTDAIFAANMHSRQLVIQDDDILVRPRIKADTEGGVPGQEFTLQVHSVEARGGESGNGLAQNDGDATAEGEVFIGIDQPGPNQPIVGVTHTTVMSKITSIVNSHPTPNGTPVPNGVSAIGRFTLSAAENSNTENGLNRVDLSGIVVTVNAQNVLLESDSITIHNTDDATISTPAVLVREDGTVIDSPTVTGHFYALFDLEGSPVNTQILSGTSESFGILGNIVDVGIDGETPSTLGLSLGNFTNQGKPFGTTPGSSHLRWRDVDAAFSVENNWIEYPDTAVKLGPEFITF